MSTGSPASRKSKIHLAFQSKVRERIDYLKGEIRKAQQDANEEVKSSSGDKYETGRAMIQLEIEKLGSQLKEHTGASLALDSLLPLPIHESIRPGTLITTSLGSFFLSVNAGEVSHGGQRIVAISPSSPLGKAMTGKCAGESVTVNGRKFDILAIE